MIDTENMRRDITINIDVTPIPIQILLTTGDKLNFLAAGGTTGIVDEGDLLRLYPAIVKGNSLDSYEIRKSNIVYIKYFSVSEEDSDLQCGVQESAYNYPWKGVNDK